MRPDLTTIDSVGNLLEVPDNYLDPDELEGIKEIFESQYKNFENLGTNYLEEVDSKYFPIIFEQIIEYANDNYISVFDYDGAIASYGKMMQVGEILYRFLCLDFYNAILPNFLDEINCDSFQNFDLILKRKYNNDFTKVKATLIKIIGKITSQLLSLQKIDTNVVKDKKYVDLTGRYAYYTQLVDFGDTERFIFNFVRPLLAKNFSEILWRTM